MDVGRLTESQCSDFKQDFNPQANPGSSRVAQGGAGCKGEPCGALRSHPGRGWTVVSSGTASMPGGLDDEMQRPQHPKARLALEGTPCAPAETLPATRLKGTRFQSLHLLSQRIFPAALRPKNLKEKSLRSLECASTPVQCPGADPKAGMSPGLMREPKTLMTNGVAWEARPGP